jgi:type I restriction enzyme S subunit
MRFQAYPAYKNIDEKWLHAIPDGWSLRRFKYLFAVIYRYPTYYDIEYTLNGVPEVRGEALAANGKILELEDQRFISETTNCQYPKTQLIEGDIVMSVRGTMGKIGIVDKRYNGANITANLIRLSPKPPVIGEFLRWLLLSDYFQCKLDKISPKTTIQTVTVPQLSDLVLPIPTPTDQRAIASFLDRETSRIDALIAKKERQIELLKEKRAALISHAVTKGLDPNVKMKDSGIEWLGQIPEHWAMKRLKYVTDQITVGIVITPSKYYEDEGVPCLRSLNIREGRIQNKDLVYISDKSNFLHSKSIVYEGDLVSVRTGQPGTTAVIDRHFHGANCIDLIIIRQSKRFDSQFLCYALNSSFSKSQYSSGATGAIQAHFNVETASNLFIPLPPISEQTSIFKWLDRKMEQIDKLWQQIESSINKLREYRTALISAAVTGKIDVRGEVNHGRED